MYNKKNLKLKYWYNESPNEHPQSQSFPLDSVRQNSPFYTAILLNYILYIDKTEAKVNVYIFFSGHI